MIKMKLTHPKDKTRAVFLFKSEVWCVGLLLGEIPYVVHNCKYGYWLNVSWNCGITAPLTWQEIEKLEEMSDA